MASSNRIRTVIALAALLMVAWCYLFFSLFREEKSNQHVDTVISISPSRLNPLESENGVRGNHNDKRNQHQDRFLDQGGENSKPNHYYPSANTIAETGKQSLDERRQHLLSIINQKLEPPRHYEVKPQTLPQPPLSEIEANMTLYLHTLHKRLSDLAGPGCEALDVWEAFLDVTKKLPMTWDEQNRNRFPMPRKDNSIFVSLGTYRDPFCPMTIKSLYANAAHPERLFVGLFQQNCFGPKCRTGVLVGGRVEEAGPDPNCYIEFCQSPEGKASNACNNGHVRLFNVNESESLGPYMARYLGAKFYRGEQYYLQIDSHSEFVKSWDNKLIKMVEDAEAEKPVISTYPPDSTQNWKDSIGFRMCDSEFAAAQIEWQIIRLGSSLAFDSSIPAHPKYAPFVAAGFFFGPADFLYEVPFDPFLPWIFMGEEISMSARLWTSGYDIFSPTVNVLNHYYVRRHYPKFWEFFKKGVHNDIVEIVINRVKSMLAYPESRPELVYPSSVLYRQNDWGMGRKRSLAKYMEMVGLNMDSKKQQPNQWCHRGEWPEIAKQYRIKK